MAELSKIPPHSVEAEQSVLGSILLDKDAMITSAEVLKAGDFYKDAHKIIYESMLNLNENNEAIDLITLKTDLEKRKYLEAVGGLSYLTSLTTVPPTTVNVKNYADIVKEKSILRQLINSSNEIISLGYDGDLPIQDIMGEAEKKIFDISQEKTGNDFIAVKDILNSVYSSIEELYRNKSELTGLDTGFKDLNKRINGFQKSDLVLIAARPAMGKTAFALNLVTNAAIKAGASVAVFSLEMSKDQLVQRLISSISNVNIQNIKTGNIADDEWIKIAESMSILSNLDIYIDDTPGLKISELRSKCRKLKLEKGLDMIMIDYLQLMEGEGRNENRQQEISKISRSLKMLAKEMHCPVVALSQLSRRADQGTDHKPKLSDLRESGAIEQDADLVMFLYRDEYYDADSEKKNIGEVIISKNRHGKTDTIELVWMGEVQKFKDKFKEIKQ